MIYYDVLEALLKELLSKGIIEDFDWGSFDDGIEQLNVITKDNHIISIDYSVLNNSIEKITHLFPIKED